MTFEDEEEAAALLHEISSLSRSTNAKQQIRAQLQLELDAVENQLRTLEAPHPMDGRLGQRGAARRSRTSSSSKRSARGGTASALVSPIRGLRSSGGQGVWDDDDGGGGGGGGGSRESSGGLGDSGAFPSLSGSGRPSTTSGSPSTDSAAVTTRSPARFAAAALTSPTRAVKRAQAEADAAKGARRGRSDSQLALEHLGLGAESYAGYKPERGVGEDVLHEAGELCAEGNGAKLEALLADPLVLKAMERTGVHKVDVRERSFAECHLKEEGSNIVRHVGDAEAQVTFDRHRETRVPQLARVLEERKVCVFMHACDVERAQKKSRAHHELEEAVAAEEARIKLVGDRAAAKQKVADTENDMLKERLKEHADVMRVREMRDAVAAERVEKERQRVVYLAEQRAANLERVKEQMIQKDLARQRACMQKIARDDERVEAVLAAKQADLDAKNARAAVRAAKREKVAADQEARVHKAKADMQESQDRRDNALAMKRQKFSDDLDRRTALRKFREQDKKDNVERIRRKQQFRMEQTKLKLLERAEELQHRAELELALQDVRSRATAAEIIRQHRQTALNATYERNVTPGPGQYHIPTTLKGGFAMSDARPKSDVEWAMLRAAAIPGPGAHDTFVPKVEAGIKFNDSNSLSDIDVAMLRASRLPAPGERQTTKFETAKTGKWGKSSAPSQLESQILKASREPGPGEYYTHSTVERKTLAQVRRRARTRMPSFAAYPPPPAAPCSRTPPHPPALHTSRHPPALHTSLARRHSSRRSWPTRSCTRRPSTLPWRRSPAGTKAC